MKTGLYIGRFQPFHLGHLSAVRQALKQVDRLFIVIGSAQYSGEKYNPFTGEERLEIIQAALKENELSKKCEIFLAPDIHDDDKWCAHVREIVPDFQLVFVGNEGLVKELFEKEGRAGIVMVKREVDVSATKIRQAIIEEGPWEDMLPQSVAKHIKTLGIHRILSASG